MKSAFAAVLGIVVASAGCNVHPVAYNPFTVERGGSRALDVGATSKLDVLWVIDNSGSMCQEQQTLRENFDRFVQQLDKTTLDFQMGVTTTHMDVDYPIEPLAKPGHIQARPQPLPGFDTSCWHGVDAFGAPDTSDWTPIRGLIETAVGCMVDPDPSFLEVTDADIACAMGCPEASCSLDECPEIDLFPGPETFRRLPTVLKSEQYRQPDGTLDVDQMQADFRCMAAVGLRGSGFEKGLGALVEAVSPGLTGGTSMNPKNVNAPNHGLIREDADFAAIFVTDENDCTHDGTLNERTACGGDVCEYWNRADLADSPLRAPEELREELLANLRATKGREDFGVANVLVASIHGTSKRYDGSITPTQECRDRGTCEAFQTCEGDAGVVEPSCASSYGLAYSGDRYERFLRSFPDGQYFPEPSTSGALTGWMCSGNFQPALEAIGGFLNRGSSGCVTEPLESCDPDLQLGDPCPNHASGEPGVCSPAPNSDRYFCDSFVEVRIAGGQATRDELESTGYCDAFRDGNCVLSPTRYELTACSGEVAGFKVEWNSPAAVRTALEGYDVELRWRASSSD